MDRDQVIAILREHEPELKAAGNLRLSLFGSTARGDRGADSDVDLLASFDETRRISLLDLVGWRSVFLKCSVVRSIGLRKARTSAACKRA